MTGTHYDLKSLGTFTRVLEVGGFQLVPGTARSCWRGPIHPSLKGLTDAATMDVVIRPGWPFTPPALVVQGLSSNHLTREGFVCMWRDDDPDLGWTTVQDFYQRISEWCERAESGWEGDDLAGDAFMNFIPSDWKKVAVVDLRHLGVIPGASGEFHGEVNACPFRVDLEPGPPQSPDHLRGAWFHAGTLTGPPPRNLAEVRTLLMETQRKDLEDGLAHRTGEKYLVPSGGVDLVLFCWERRSQPDLLIIGCAGTGQAIQGIALQAGPDDPDSLILRAGPDAQLLRDRKVTVFGLGALGGHVALILAESGVGFLNLVDADVLLPGNVVRHVAGHSDVGSSKVEAVRSMIDEHAPWAEVSVQQGHPITPDQIRALMGEADLVVDPTGNGSFRGALSLVADSMNVPLISGALYRGGRIGRVQRQAVPGDVPLFQRDASLGFLDIPKGDGEGEIMTSGLGCSAPVNNAPPVSVSSCSSLIAQCVIDVLTGRFDLGSEVIDVYNPLPEKPFDRVGRVLWMDEPSGLVKGCNVAPSPSTPSVEG